MKLYEFRDEPLWFSSDGIGERIIAIAFIGFHLFDRYKPLNTLAWVLRNIIMYPVGYIVMLLLSPVMLAGILVAIAEEGYEQVERNRRRYT